VVKTPKRSGHPDHSVNHNNKITEEKRGADASEDHRVTIENGRVALHGALKAEWLRSFDADEEALRLALLEVTVQPKNPTPLEGQVSKHLARIVREKRDRDQRYAKAAQANQRKPSSSTKKGVF
jgi:hypothetical protein